VGGKRDVWWAWVASGADTRQVVGMVAGDRSAATAPRLWDALPDGYRDRATVHTDVLAQYRPAGQLLLGFSKSGWGAYSLLLRNPEVFGRAAAWDAPLMTDAPGRYGSGEAFVTPENFRRYELTQLVAERADRLRGGHRLVLTGYGNFRAEHQRFHALLEKLGVPHAYRDGPAATHDWRGGWIAEAARLLLASGP
jgi:enterochelin esterase-like enzyme